MAILVTLSDETLCPCCQWSVPIFTSLNPIFHTESSQPRRPLIHSGHRDKSWKPQRQEGTSARVPASSRPRAEIKRDPGSFGAVPRAFCSLRRSSRSQRPPAPPRNCAGAPQGSGERLANEEETREARSAQARGAPPPQRRLPGGRRGPSHSPPRRLTAPALASPRRAPACASSRRPAGPGPPPASPPLLLAAPARVHAVARAGAAAGNRSPSHTYPAPSPPFPPSRPPPSARRRCSR